MAYTPRRNVRQIHWLWVVMAVIALAIPLTIFISSQNTDNRQHASEIQNPVIGLQLKGPCQGKNENNTYRHAEYVCQNSARGELPNNNNSCDKRADWMAKAEVHCRNQATRPTATSVPPPPATAATSTPTPTDIIIVDPISITDPNPPQLKCSVTGNSTTIGPQGAFLAAQLVDSAQKPIYNATITWRTEPTLLNNQGFSSTTKTGERGNGATYNFVAPQPGIGNLDILGAYEYTIPGTQNIAKAECRIIFANL